MNHPVCARTLLPLLAAFFLAGCGVLQVNVENSSAVSGTKTPVSATATGTKSDVAWFHYTSRLYPLSFQYPTTWKGPVEEELGGPGQDRQIRITIGSDMVEPWDMETNPYPDGAYVIAITFLENASQASLYDLSEKYPEIAAWTDLELVANGQSTMVRKLQYTRLDSIAAGEFRGLEFVAATPPNAQASIVYRHYAVLVNSRSQYLIVAGDIPNPGPKTTESWFESIQAVDEKYRNIFRYVVSSIYVGS